MLIRHKTRSAADAQAFLGHIACVYRASPFCDDGTGEIPTIRRIVYRRLNAGIRWKLCSEASVVLAAGFVMVDSRKEK